MTTAYAIIGAGYGDEGKGLITDHLVRRLESPLVARFNGGGQASHTVVTPDGRRHVFSHVGAGSFAGAKTFLGRRFIINPYILDAEMAELQRKGLEPQVTAHPGAAVTTIFDMALNAAAELARGGQRHGSCGIGINETVTRHLAGFTLTAEDARFATRRGLKEVLRAIREDWVPRRLKQLGITDLPTGFHLRTGEVLQNDNYDEHVVRLLMGMSHIEVTDELDDNERPLVLEGAQGLALDEELGEFPHVTRSITGLPWALELAADYGYHELQPIYVTRAYATRHGAGPLAHDGEFITHDGSIGDQTNVPNDWQGRIRFAPLDLQVLKRYIEADLARTRASHIQFGVTTKVLDPVIALTCLDQLGEFVRVYNAKGALATIHRESLPSLVTKELGVTVSMVSRGPASTDVVHLATGGV